MPDLPGKSGSLAVRRLALLRHAKSSWDDPSLADHDRPLTPRGRRAATRIGRHMSQEGATSDLVLCSSAIRARCTLELLDLDPQPTVLVEDRLYGASADQLLARLRQIDNAMSVLVVGHNPGLHNLALELSGDDERLEAFPTAALAQLGVPIPAWSDLGPGVATLLSLTLPKRLG